MHNKFVSDRQFLLSIKPLTDLLRRFFGFTQMVCAKVKIISNGFSDYLTRTIVKLPLDNTHVLPVHNGGHYWWRRLTRCCGALPANNTEEDSRRNSQKSSTLPPLHPSFDPRQTGDLYPRQTGDLYPGGAHSPLMEEKHI